MTIRDDFLVPGGAQRSRLFERVFACTVLEAGTRIGPYRVVRELGRGGMGVVYLAERADGEFEQTVALKLVSGRAGDTRAQEQLRGERQILASLQHPGIARLLDGGSDGEGRLWFALEYVEGIRIDEYCDERRLASAERLRLVIDICNAIQFAHARLLVHRDIKPSNILVNQEANTKLIDFGIAQLLVADARAAAGPHALTPAYASPEQLQGLTVGTASDIFQLGRLLQHVTSEAGQAGANADLCAIVAKATHEQPADRYATVAELRADLEGVLAHRPVLARRGGLVYRGARFVRRHRVGVIAAGVAAAAFIATVAGFTLRLTHERDQALAAERHAKLEALRANRIKDFLSDTFRVADPGINRGERLTANEILDRGATDAIGALANEPEVEASLLGVIGEAYVGLGDFPRADPLLTRALALQRSVTGVEPKDIGHSLRALAWLRHKQSRFADARGLLDESLAQLEAAPGATDEIAAALDQKALALKHLGDTAGALAYAQSAVATAREGGADARRVTTLDHLGLLYYALDRESDAVHVFEEALPLSEGKLGERDARTISVRENYALTLAETGQGERAESMMQRAIAAEQAIYGADSANVVESLLLLGNLETDIDRTPRAIGTYRQALSAASHGTTVGSETLASLHANLGSALADTDMPDEALAEFDRAIAVYERTHTAPQFEIAHVHHEHACVLHRLGRDAEGETELRAAIAVYETQLPPEHRYRVVGAASLAEILAARGSRDEALDLLRRTLPAIDRLDSSEKKAAVAAHVLFERLSTREAKT
jgi:serine/threonine protein kinase